MDRFCFKCGYNLCHIDSPRCPECGHPYDVNDIRTTAAHRPTAVIRFFGKLSAITGYAIVSTIGAGGFWEERIPHISISWTRIILFSALAMTVPIVEFFFCYTATLYGYVAKATGRKVRSRAAGLALSALAVSVALAIGLPSRVAFALSRNALSRQTITVPGRGPLRVWAGCYRIYWTSTDRDGSIFFNVGSNVDLVFNNGDSVPALSESAGWRTRRLGHRWFVAERAWEE